ncbi:MAG: Ig-like domain-containing protein, partial [Chloroflexota bacterium]
YVRALAIDPGKSKVIDPDFEAAHTGAPGSGLIDGCQYSVVLTSPQPIAVVANAHNDIGAPSAYSHNGLASGATTLYAPYALRTASLFSNVVVQNLGTAAVTATLTFTPLAGGAAQTFTLAGVPGGGSRPFDVRYTNGDTAQPFCAPGVTTGCLAVGEYSLKIAAPTPIAAVVLPVSSTTAAGYLASASPTQRALVPAAFRTIGGPAGWSTTLYVQSVTATQATLRWFRLDTGDLAATQTLTLVAGTTARVDPRSVSGLAENTQYSATVDANGTVAAIAFEQAATGGDASMIFEAFALPAQAATGQAGSIRVSPTSATVATGATQQLTASVFDQFGAAMPNAARTWTVAPATLGTVSAAGLFTAGNSAGAGTVTVTSGQVSASAALTVSAPTTVTVGGISFVLQSSADSDLYMESTISSADRSTIATQAAADVAQIRIDFARPFSVKPRLYVFTTTTSYTLGLQSILGLSSSEAANVGSSSTGIWVQNATAHAIAADWQKQRANLPVTVMRHELAHWMQHQIVSGDIPAWLDEGNAR